MSSDPQPFGGVTPADLGIITNIKPKHPEFRSDEERRRSFGERGSPFALQLSEAGFFYDGNNGTFCCFHCDGRLKKWKSGDDPLEVHGRYFPHCDFVRNVTGKDNTSPQEPGFGEHSEDFKMYASSLSGDGWGSKLEFVMTCGAYSLGIGAILSFLRVCFSNGGGSLVKPGICLLWLFMCRLMMPILDPDPPFVRVHTNFWNWFLPCLSHFLCTLLRSILESTDYQMYNEIAHGENDVITSFEITLADIFSFEQKVFGIVLVSYTVMKARLAIICITDKLLRRQIFILEKQNALQICMTIGVACYALPLTSILDVIKRGTYYEVWISVDAYNIGMFLVPVACLGFVLSRTYCKRIKVALLLLAVSKMTAEILVYIVMAFIFRENSMSMKVPSLKQMSTVVATVEDLITVLLSGLWVCIKSAENSQETLHQLWYQDITVLNQVYRVRGYQKCDLLKALLTFRIQKGILCPVDANDILTIIGLSKIQRERHLLKEHADLSEQDLEQLTAENEILKSRMQCSMCIEGKANIIFLPCGHLNCCPLCAPNFENCSVCRQRIHGTVKAHFATLADKQEHEGA